MILEYFMDKLYFGSGTQKTTFLLLGSGTLVPPLFRFDGTEVPFPNPISKIPKKATRVTIFCYFL